MANNWHALHYNTLAKEIRGLFPASEPTTFAELNKSSGYLQQRAILTTLALNLAKRFEGDNERFDPIKFLNACSPNVDLYPLGELWEDYTNARQ